jgi:hypothetical protein
MGNAKLCRFFNCIFYPFYLALCTFKSFINVQQLSVIFPPNTAMIDYLQGHNDMEPVYVPREVKNPEKIYATLQETRDSCSFKKTEGIFFIITSSVSHGIYRR